MNNRQWVVAGMLVAAVMLGIGRAQAKGWDKKYVGSLKDDSFASIETGSSGEKLRHLPYRDDSGKVDPSHLRAALRAWKKVKWTDQADAQPALNVLKNEESKLCATGAMKCGGAKKPKAAKAKKTKIKHPKAASAKAGKAPKTPKVAKAHKPRKTHVAKAKAPKKAAGAKLAHKPAPKKAAPKPA